MDIILLTCISVVQ